MDASIRTYNENQVVEWKKITEFIEQYGAVPGIQIAHAGRKASTKNPWKVGNRHEKQQRKCNNFFYMIHPYHFC